MTTPPDERESIWSIRSRWRPLYATLFITQLAASTIARTIWTLDPETDGKLSALWLNLPHNGAASAVSTITITEVFDIMLGTRDVINEWLKKRRDQARTQGLTQGLGQAITEKQAAWENWYNRMQDAQADGQPFEEPPPSIETRQKIDGTRFIVVTPDEPQNPTLHSRARYGELEGTVTNLDPYGVRGHGLPVNLPYDPARDDEYQPRITDIEITLD